MGKGSIGRAGISVSLATWAKQPVPVGIGIDLVSVSQLQEMERRTKGAFSAHTFSPRELEEADSAQDRWVYLAGRFAAKEAVFKAVAHLLREKWFDFRLVQTLSGEDGAPSVVCGGPLRTILDHANVSSLLISISNEEDYAVAIVQAVGAQTGNESSKSQK